MKEHFEINEKQHIHLLQLNERTKASADEARQLKMMLDLADKRYRDNMAAENEAVNLFKPESMEPIGMYRTLKDEEKTLVIPVREEPDGVRNLG